MYEMFKLPRQPVGQLRAFQVLRSRILDFLKSDVERKKKIGACLTIERAILLLLFCIRSVTYIIGIMVLVCYALSSWPATPS